MNTASQANAGSGLGFMVNRDGTVVAQVPAAQAAGTQQPPQQQQQQSSASSAQNGQSSKNKNKKKKKNKKSKAQQEKSFSKNKLADLLKEKEKELKEQQAKCAELEKKLKDTENAFGSDDSDMEEGGSETSGISSANSIVSVSDVPSNDKPPADTTNDANFVKPNPVAKSPIRKIDSNKPKSSSLMSTPKRTENHPLAVHGLDTPASKLVSAVQNCAIETPSKPSSSTANSHSDPLNGVGKENDTSTPPVQVLKKISPLPDSDPDSISKYHKCSGLFKNVNARYCSLQEKMKLEFDDFGCYTCPRCKEEVQYYQKGDTIPLLITTSTLARTHKDILNEEGVCSHFEIIELPGARISEMSIVVNPIIEFLSKYNKVQVLCVVGVNDFLLKNNGLDNILKDFDQFSDSVNTGEFFQNVNVKFIGIPMIPSLCKFENDFHVVRMERTQDIIKYNELLSSYNATVDKLAFYVPTLMFKGIRKFAEEPTFPNNYHHVPECWDNWDWEIPRKNCIHLAAHVKRAFWAEVQRFFKCATKK